MQDSIHVYYKRYHEGRSLLLVQTTLNLNPIINPKILNPEALNPKTLNPKPFGWAIAKGAALGLPGQDD